MVDRPILFSAPMVRAILDGQKTQTRRVVKPQPLFNEPGRGFPLSDGATTVVDWKGLNTSLSGLVARCPYGRPGDRLWVKETHRFDIAYDTLKPTEMDSHAAIWYEADRAVIGGGVPGKIRVSLHMQRRFSRLLLEIVSIRVERLNDCSREDALAEGVREPSLGEWVDCGFGEVPRAQCAPETAYAALWEHINGAGSWSANPWVWVVEFKRVQA